MLVTGATAGIGRETATLFARHGASVVITGRDTERGAQTVAAIEAEGGRAEFIAADLSDIESVRRLAEQAGEVDVLVNNAAAQTVAPTMEQDVESFDMMFDVNVRGPFFLTAALLPKMIARGSGVIVNISGALASVGDANAPVGAAAKAAMESLTRSWAAAFGVNGIRVNTVAPGPTRTDSAVGAFGDALEKLGSATPLGRAAHPNEIAEVIVFLASSRASYLTGATVAVDGGYTAI
ncbi:MAG TPA: SDR family oxidoreductase [Candidatus Dormibacteraeota bacterium]|nr:SDR family oxidoreductase [Candidatus Dormibacteraeota bacterium]